MLDVDDVSKSFGDHAVLRKVSFKASEGRVTALLGANGCGKTTTFRLIMGLLAPDEGTITNGGVPVARRQVGYVPEQRSLFVDCTVDAQLKLLGRLRGMPEDLLEMRIGQWLAALGLTAARYRPIRILSKGSQQKVQLAAAVLHDPTLLILDEPFNGLDQDSVQALAAVIERLKEKGRIIIMSFHQYAMAGPLADDYLLLEQGRLTAAVTRQQLDADPRRILAVRAAAGFQLHDDSIIASRQTEDEVRYTVADRQAAGRLMGQLHDDRDVQAVSLGPLSIADVIASGARS